MTWIIKLTYLDGKELNVTVPEEELTKFLEASQKGLPYWAPNKETAFMTHAANVRYINIAQHKEAEPEEAPKEA